MLLRAFDSWLILNQRMHVFRWAMLDYVVREISAKGMTQTIRLGCAMILNGVAIPTGAGPCKPKSWKARRDCSPRYDPLKSLYSLKDAL